MAFSVDAPRRNEFYRVYDDYTGRGTLANVTWLALPNTNHTLVMGGAEARIVEAAPAWILDKVGR